MTPAQRGLAWRQIRLVARLELTDFLRQRRIGISLTATSFIGALFLFVVPGFMAQRDAREEEGATYRIAVQGESTDVTPIVARWSARLRVTRSEDARAAVLAGQADAGLVVPPGSGAAFEGDGAASVRTIALAARKRSRFAVTILTEQLARTSEARAAERLADRRLPVATARPLQLDVVDLGATSRGGRIAMGYLMPYGVLVCINGLLATTASLLAAAKDRRRFESQLVLPISRRSLVAGKGLAALALSAFAAPALVVPALSVRLVPASTIGRTIDAPWAVLPAAGAAAVLLLLLIVSLGLVIGAAARGTVGVTSALPFAALGLLVPGLVLQVRPSIPAAWHLLVTPVVGALLLIREATIGDATFGQVVVVVFTTVFWCALLVALAARLVDRDASVLRPTR